MPGWIRARAAATAALAVVPISATSLAMCLATSSVVAGRSSRPGPWRRSALQHGADAGRGGARGLQEIKIPTQVHCEVCNVRCPYRQLPPRPAHLPRLRPGADAPGLLRGAAAAPHCHGRGKIIKDPCRKCHGEGRYQKTKTLSVKIPAGVDTGDRIRLRRRGSGETGASAGICTYRFTCASTRSSSVTATTSTAKCPSASPRRRSAARLKCRPQDGRVKLKVTPETQTGKLFRLRGKAHQSPVRSRPGGDLMCKVVIETPVKLTETEKICCASWTTPSAAPLPRLTSRNPRLLRRVKRFFDDLTK